MGAFVSCIPGKLGYFESEEPGERYVLERAVYQPAEADGAREVGGGVAAAHARRSLAGALGR